MWSCDVGLKIRPEAGAVVLWYNLLPNGNVDSNSLHGGCPVAEKSGLVKWAANKWVWNKRR